MYDTSKKKKEKRKEKKKKQKKEDSVFILSYAFLRQIETQCYENMSLVQHPDA